MSNGQMRDPKRIEEFLNILKEIWEKQPDTRFYQLIHNLAWEYHKETGKGLKRTLWEQQHKFTMFRHFDVDLYNVEDEDFIEWLKGYNI